jgi:hypothetical protein
MRSPLRFVLWATLLTPALLHGCACGDLVGVTDGGPQSLDRTGDDAGRVECGADEDCPFGEVCRAGACRTSDPSLNDTGCWTDDDCVEGQRCAPSTGRCVDEADFPEPPPEQTGPCANGETRFCGTKVGACAYGTETCVDGQWAGTCEDAVDPVAELCDGDDNDCNGNTDETFTDLGLDCSVGMGECARTGNFVCAADGLGATCNADAAMATTMDELCGGHPDEDCDGQQEEGFETEGNACTVGVGICQATGFLTCSMDRTTLECSATPGMAAPAEICDGVRDDDCDGNDDNTEFPLLGTACTVGAPPCTTAGTYQCKADGTGVECVPDSNVGDETLCDGNDEDNDGCPDDGFPLGNSCAVGVGQCRNTGVLICSVDQLGTTCDASPLAGNANELCDYVDDDDCDGIPEVDEFPTRGDQCFAGLGECRTSGSLVCTPDGSGVECNAMPPAGVTELCGNNKDDDCDGVPDADEFPAIGLPCVVGVGACQRAGQWVCDVDSGTVQCSANPGSPVAEKCDGVDQNCNPFPDDGCDDDGDGYCDAGMEWTAGAAAVCPNTTSVLLLDCNDENVNIHPGAAEICNDGNLDSNCDGDPNDGCNACVRGTDSDLDGSDDCDDCAPLNGAIYPGATEVCDGLDNDCVGGPDDGFDSDGDNYTTCGTIFPAGGIDPARVDCNDGDDTIHPFACELCALGGVQVACNQPNDSGDGVDQNCDGYVDETCEPCDSSDADDDGYSDCEGDCDDGDPTVNPAAPEVCDGKDNDCNLTTRKNCDVSDDCNHDGQPPTDGPDDPDICGDDLFCVEALGPGGNGSGNFSCTSLCNYSELGLGLGDGCRSDEVCTVNLTPTANQYGCRKATDFGTQPPGTEVLDLADCRSGTGFATRKVMGTDYYECTDHCGNDSYCSNGTVCTTSGEFPNTLWRAECRNPVGTLGLGQDCSSSGFDCRSGFFSCLEVSPGTEICSQACCSNADCPNGYYCEVDTERFAGPSGGWNTVPMCWPDTDTGPRTAGTACSSNDQCASGFCDVNLNICIELCCNDNTCAAVNASTTCEDARMVLPDRPGEPSSLTFARVCLSQTPAEDLEAMP